MDGYIKNYRNFMRNWYHMSHIPYETEENKKFARECKRDARNCFYAIQREVNSILRNL